LDWGIKRWVPKQFLKKISTKDLNYHVVQNVKNVFPGSLKEYLLLLYKRGILGEERYNIKGRLILKRPIEQSIGKWQPMPKN
jgi:hypothetical protein